MVQRTQKKDFKEQRQNKWDSQPHQPTELDNADFETYYKQQVSVGQSVSCVAYELGCSASSGVHRANAASLA